VGVVSVGPPSNGGKTFLVTVIKPTTTVFWWDVYIGPNITDVFGNLMDQNANDVLGEANDYYSFRHVGAVLSQ
jgi:hypothetical protein